MLAMRGGHDTGRQRRKQPRPGEQHQDGPDAKQQDGATYSQHIDKDYSNFLLPVLTGIK